MGLHDGCLAVVVVVATSNLRVEWLDWDSSQVTKGLLSRFFVDDKAFAIVDVLPDTKAN